MDSQDRSRHGNDSDRSDGSTAERSGLTERLRDVLGGDGDGDLLLERDDLENRLMPWLQALDSQVIGACRADERLRPLPKIGIGSGVVEDCLLAQLSQHFEVTEVGMIARCLCIPLVSIRVGKINKQGNLLCPTSSRGHLSLTLLPSSNMRITFTGDDGCEDRLALVFNDSETADVTIQEIATDSSGRSFLLELPGSQVCYFWCSEKSNHHGKELLVKMKDLLKRRPSLSHLTGISDSRLGSFANHFRAYLLGSSGTARMKNSTPLSSISQGTTDAPSILQSWSSLKSSRHRLTAGHATKLHAFCQGSLSPKPNSFKEVPAKSITSLRGGNKDKLRRRAENYPNMVATSGVNFSGPQSGTLSVPSSGLFEDTKVSDYNEDSGSMKSCKPDSISSPSFCFSPLSSHAPVSVMDVPNSVFSPHYCWSLPPLPVTLFADRPCFPPTSESFHLPPLSTLLSDVRSTLSSLSCKQPSDTTHQILDLPPVLPEPLVCLPFTATSLVAISSTQQVPTFTPLMSDPIVHIPVIDVCSAGQGYLVSAGPAISSAIPSCLPKSGSCLVPHTESLVEKGARETLRLLMASTPTPSSNELMNVLPVVFSRISENLAVNNVEEDDKVPHDGKVSVSSSDVNAIEVGVSSLELTSASEGSCTGCTIGRIQAKQVSRKDPSDSPADNID